MPASSPLAATSDHGDLIVTDVLVAGAGAVGLSLAIALARAGLRTVVAGVVQRRPSGRTVALLEGSVDFLKSLDVWTALETHAAPLRTMRLVDDTDSLFRVPPVAFEARDLGRDRFGVNIENVVLVDRLAGAAARAPNLTFVEGLVDRYRFAGDAVTADLAGGRQISAGLVAAADGRMSAARRASGLAARAWSYPQAALTALLGHSRPHAGISTEFHTRQGPFTLVPLVGSADAPHRSSLVWVMSPKEARRRGGLGAGAFTREVEQQSRFLLGDVWIEGAVGSFPIGGMTSARMVAPRLALAGEAAHAFPPIGAQGLNLGLRDAAALAAILGEAHRAGLDPGSTTVLDRYARARQADVTLRTFGVDWLNRALLADLLPVDLLRGAGLLALGTFAPLRRLAMRAGLNAGAAAPRDGGIDDSGADRRSPRKDR